MASLDLASSADLIMCGITGIISLDGSPIDRQQLERMTSSLEHRGPDQHGYFVQPGVGLGHRRLSIIDLSAGKQPMLSKDGATALTYNGEIYNYRELRAQLQTRGHVFDSSSDTEVLLHAWLEWREKCVEKLRGMFAFAVWDAKRKSLFLARDRLGIKPLYYGHTSDGSFIFGSELKALRVHSSFVQDIDPIAVEQYFAFGYVPEPKSIYKAALKLPAGHTLTLSREKRDPTISKYWDIPFAGTVPSNEGDLRSELVERLKEAVAIRLVADVPLGAFLSGGVDSSAVVKLMTESAPDTVRTFSITFNEPAFDESEFASMVARACQTRHTSKTVEIDDFELLDALGGVYDEPYADSSALPTFRLCQLAREHVTVALSGDGGDENFGGYWRYREYLRAARIQEFIPPPMRRLLAGPATALLSASGPTGIPRRIHDKFQYWGNDLLENYMHSIAVVKRSARRSMYSRNLVAELADYDAIEVLRGHASRAPIDSGLPLILYLDFKTYLVDDILTKVDRASMANSLEVRVPVLDHEFVEWASAVPQHLKMQARGEGKYIFKRSMESRLPHEILYRAKKGFSVPLSRWFQGPLRDRVQTMLRSEHLNDCGYFAPDFLQRLAGDLDRSWHECSSQLWALMMFESFLKNQRRS